MNINVSTWNSYANESELDFNYTISDALDYAELQEDFSNWEQDSLDD